jgi:ketosteroid isomerase-like protein
LPPDADRRAVLDAAERRAAALAARDADALRVLMHESLRWTTHRGDVLDRERYIAGNTGGTLIWHGQRLEEVDVVAEGDVAVLTAVVVDEVEEDGGTRVNRLRLTQTWVRSGGSWVCLAGHAGPPVD